MTSFKDLILRKESIGKKVLSFEFFPPKKAEALLDTEKLISSLAELSPDFMTVTYGAGGGTREYSKRLVSFIANEIKIPAVSHLTCVGHSRAEISELLNELKANGVSHVLALRGDPPQVANSLSSDVEESFVPHPEGFSSARDLAKYIGEEKSFHVAVAAYPEGHKDAKHFGDELQYLKEKVEAPAELVITQLFFDTEVYFSFLEKTKKVGITAPILPGIMPIQSVSQVERFTSMCGASLPEKLLSDLKKIEGDKERVIEFGIEYATMQIKALLDGGAPGVHLYTINKSFQVERIVNNLSSYFS